MTPTHTLIEAIAFKSTIPMLAALDIAKEVQFYEQKLGFTAQFVMDAYASVARGAVVIHLWQCGDNYIAQNTGCRIHITGIDTLYRDYEAQGVIHPNGRLTIKPWGTSEFAVLDLDGNCITFFEANPLDKHA